MSSEYSIAAVLCQSPSISVSSDFNSYLNYQSVTVAATTATTTTAIALENAIAIDAGVAIDASVAIAIDATIANVTAAFAAESSVNDFAAVDGVDEVSDESCLMRISFFPELLPLYLSPD